MNLNEAQKIIESKPKLKDKVLGYVIYFDKKEGDLYITQALPDYIEDRFQTIQEAIKIANELAYASFNEFVNFRLAEVYKNVVITIPGFSISNQRVQEQDIHKSLKYRIAKHSNGKPLDTEFVSNDTDAHCAQEEFLNSQNEDEIPFFLKHPEQALVKYVNVEVNPCIITINGIEFFDSRKHGKIDFYSIYLRRAEGYVENIADFPHAAQAESFAELMRQVILQARCSAGLTSPLIKSSLKIM